MQDAAAGAVLGAARDLAFTDVDIGDIAQACFLPRSMAAAHLDALCALGHLQSLQIGNSRYFELREPLMRLSFEVKKHRGKPIGLLLDFLRLWYSPAELRKKLSAHTGNVAGVEAYLPDLPAIEQDWKDPRVAECCREYGKAIRGERYAEALKAAEELVAIRGLKQDSMAQASCLMRLGRLERALEIVNRIIDRMPEDAPVWRLRASILSEIGNYEEALASCRKSIELDGTVVENRREEASILLNLQRGDEAIRACEAALELNDSDPQSWTALGVTLASLDLFAESLRAFSRAAELRPKDPGAYIHACAALMELSRWDEALEQIQRAIDIDSREPEAWVLRGSVLAGMKKHEDALRALDRAIALGETSSYVQFKRVELLLALDRWREGARQLDKALAQFAQAEHPDAGDTKAVIRNLFRSLDDPEVLRLSMKVLFLLYRKHGMLGALAQGLIELIPDILSSPGMDGAAASRWEQSWRTVAEDLPDFRLPLRLLESAIRYRDTRDLSIFMGLSQEERTLLEALVGVHVEAIA